MWVLLNIWFQSNILTLSSSVMSHRVFVVKYLTVIKYFQCLTYLSPFGVCCFKDVTKFLSVSMHNILIPLCGLLSVVNNRDMNRLITIWLKQRFVENLAAAKYLQNITNLFPSGVCYLQDVTEFLSVSMHNIFILLWVCHPWDVTERNSVSMHNILIPLWGMLLVGINRDMNITI